MDSLELSVKQLDALFDKLRPMAFYPGKLRQRMEPRRFAESDELLELLRGAESAMQRLVQHVNSQAVHKSRHRKQTDIAELP